MQKGNLVILCITAVIFYTACKRPEEIKQLSPRQEFPGLFEAVQSAHLYADSKTFADCIPNSAPAEIMKAYQKEKGTPGFSLQAFVSKHFTIPSAAAAEYVTDTTQDVAAHITVLWNVLKREPDQYNAWSSLIALPHPYIVPGGRFREIYYWDSYFTMLGLKESGRTDIIEQMINNFAHLIRTYGFIPNGNRTYYLTRSQPPYFALMVDLLISAKQAQRHEILTTYQDALEKEYQFWTRETTGGHVMKMPDGALLARYHDRGNWPREEAWTEDMVTAKNSGRQPVEIVYRELRTCAESGWDFSSRWLEDGKSLESIHITDIIPVDLNCLLYYLEKTLAAAYLEKGQQQEAQKMEHAASQRAAAIQRYCWDPATGWFRDYDHKKQMQTVSLNLAGMYPLFFGIARTGQADSVSVVLRQQFLKPGGLVTTPVNTGQQWDAPNGWAPLQWMSVAGLLEYHKDSLAADVAGRWAQLNVRTFQRTGKLLEKYNVADTSLAGGGGEYPNQDGFGWTNGVLLKMLHMQQRGELNNEKISDILKHD